MSGKIRDSRMDSSQAKMMVSRESITVGIRTDFKVHEKVGFVNGKSQYLTGQPIVSKWNEQTVH